MADRQPGLLSLHGWGEDLCIAKKPDGPHLLLIELRKKVSKDND
ncbi:hypothetical protein SS05631_b54070 (plasmid) [Sinorhizobium sp. CCBAU 05631]|nr:hypothetical protein SS05631_b54070 [Sinorhizobium sp. CCBAU 05631]